MRSCAMAEQGALTHFALDAERLDDVGGLCCGGDPGRTIRTCNPLSFALATFRGRRHRSLGRVRRQLHGRGVSEVARVRIDLCTVSVLLDAGAGPAWRYREPETGLVLQRSEGLAVASLHAFRSGLFSADPQQPLRADAHSLGADLRRRLGGRISGKRRTIPCLAWLAVQHCCATLARRCRMAGSADLLETGTRRPATVF